MEETTVIAAVTEHSQSPAPAPLHLLIPTLIAPPGLMVYMFLRHMRARGEIIGMHSLPRSTA